MGHWVTVFIESCLRLMVTLAIVVATLLFADVVIEIVTGSRDWPQSTPWWGYLWCVVVVFGGLPERAKP